ncbi:MAG: zinc ribbon domain-containing protein [Candidatus Bathyarchaeia archaeon]
MRKHGINGGIFLIVAGFIIYQIGMLIVINYPSFLRDGLTTIFRESSSLDLLGLILVFGGGILGVFGLLRLVRFLSDVVSNTVYAQRQETIHEISNLRTSISDMVTLMAKEVSSPKSSTEKTCKFCGSKIDENAIFCSICNKSQI